MDKQIKFRCWLDTFNKMFIPTSLYYHAEANQWHPAGFCGTDPDTKHISYEVMQFSGFTDIEGLDLYDGDIVNANYHWGGHLRNLKRCPKIIRHS